ncbi:MAG TPA: hypothetical protein PLE48_12335 [Thiobacillus sp.]|nr:MAG: hypothetical protein B7Y21_00525 [Hydrogenophilales bacterium 16-61-112]OZA51109.1 MAG: hypothetical protein B7X81_00230 [Hydrogenophilales bacterium 17-61-76]HQT31698.1 hypothetical protein [Thiobacillus sp.]HQT71197.1 hypothetical protein [Thiobacillus sp.]
MIAAIVGAIILIVLALVIVWYYSPAFRVWTEKPKYTMLERDALFERTGIGNRLPTANIEKLDGLNDMKNKGKHDENRY